MEEIQTKYTADAQEALQKAEKLAKAHKMNQIDSRHLLLAILENEKSQTVDWLRRLRVDVPHMVARLRASLSLDAKTHAEAIENSAPVQSTALSAILSESQVEAIEQGVREIDPRLLLIGMARKTQSDAGIFLAQYGLTTDWFHGRYDVVTQPAKDVPKKEKLPKISTDFTLFGISPVFIGLVTVTLLSGALAYLNIINARAAMFIFIIGGWVTSVALHEFGHAVVAFWGGDKSVVDKGYLTLNPLRYTNPLLSIILPVVFLLMGGIGLPGGAVYIEVWTIRKDYMRSLMSAAGPIMSFLFALLCATPFIFNVFTVYDYIQRPEFVAGLALMSFLQITAVFLNMLPIPGLDGYGVLEPFLPANIANAANQLRPFGFLILYLVIFLDSPIQMWFWESVFDVTATISPEMSAWVFDGLELILFWRF